MVAERPTREQAESWRKTAAREIERIEAIRSVPAWNTSAEEHRIIGIDAKFGTRFMARVDSAHPWNELWDGWDVDGAAYETSPEDRTVVCHGIISGRPGADIEIRITDKQGRYGVAWASELDIL